MERETKNPAGRAGRAPSPAATAGFLLLACALIYGCVRLVGSVLTNELRSGEAPGGRWLKSGASTPAQPSPTPDAHLSVAAVYAPTLSPTPTCTPTPAESGSPAPAAVPVPTPRPTLRPIADPAPFSADRMDLFLAMFDPDSGADWITLISVRGTECRALSVPRNTVTVAGTAVGEETSARLLMSRLPGVFPVRYRRYVSFSPDALARFIAVFGNVTVDGRELDAEDLDAYLSGGGADELLRIARQQEALRGCLKKLNGVSGLALLRSRSALQSAIASNLTAGELLDACGLLRRIDPDKVRFELLPVDSVTVNGTRYYRCDPARVNGLAEALYPD